MGIHYLQMDNDTWFELSKGWRFKCCDCSLIHEVQVRVKKGTKKTFEIRVIRNERATSAARRKRVKV